MAIWNVILKQNPLAPICNRHINYWLLNIYCELQTRASEVKYFCVKSLNLINLKLLKTY